MKTTLLLFFLFFLFTSNIYAKDVYLSCESITKFKTSFIINDEKKRLILNGIEREVVSWTREFITFWKSEMIKEISEPRNFKPDTLDRISGSYGSYSCNVVEKTLF